MTEQLDFPLEESAASDVVVMNGRCTLRAEGEQRVVLVAGLPVHHYDVSDAVAASYAMVLLADCGYATQCEIARAFGCTERTVRRHQKRYEDGGMTALATKSGWRSGRRRIAGRRLRTIARLRAAGLNNCEIARRLGVTENAVRKQVGSSAAPIQEQLPLPDAVSSASSNATVDVGDGATSVAPETQAVASNESEDTAPSSPPLESTAGATHDDHVPAALNLDIDPMDRSWDRLLACLGLLDDAAPMFENAAAVPGAAVLCAVPLLAASGVFAAGHKMYGEIGPAFYGLRTTLLTLLFMALWRIKRPEALKEHDPQSLGRVLGLDRAPEVKTIRRKLSRLASYHKAEELGRELARLRVEARGQMMGFLYVDGHVRVYHGKRTIPKTHVARMRLALPATSDYWINDQAGDPLFVMTAEANAGMVKMLPEVLAQIRELVGDRHVTIVFDRGGWSPALFKQMIKDGFGILTYRKGKCRRIAAHRFELCTARIDGKKVEYRLHDQGARFLNGKLRLRQVTRLTDDGHQTQVLTTQWSLPAIEVAYRMFERWRQENFFKYMREEFLLDALVDYAVEPDDPTRTVPNPKRKALDKKIRDARARVAKLEQAYGAAAVDNEEGRRPTMRGFKIAHAKLGKELRAAKDHVADLVARRRSVPKRVEVRDRTDGAVVKLSTERKHLTNIIKMLAYQAESDLLAFLSSHYARASDEGRTLLHELFRSSADIEITGAELRVTVCPLSSPHRTNAVQALCDTLTATETVFPGTTLKMQFAVHQRPQVGMAFPGPRSSPDAEVAAGPGQKPDISREG